MFLAEKEVPRGGFLEEEEEDGITRKEVSSKKRHDTVMWTALTITVLVIMSENLLLNCC